MTYCAFCGEAYDIQDREKALELITEHVSVCPKHPIAELRARHAALVEAAKNVCAWPLDKDWSYMREKLIDLADVLAEVK